MPNEIPMDTPIQGRELRQGRCRPCDVLVKWDERGGPLRGALCPRCQRPLDRTTSECKSPRIRIDRPDYA